MLKAAEWWSYPMAQVFMGVAMLLCDWLSDKAHTEILAQVSARRAHLPPPVLSLTLVLSCTADMLSYAFKLLAVIFFALATVALMRG